MITAHVNEMGIVLRFGSIADNFSHEAWDSLLNELKSHPIPSFYQNGKRLHLDWAGEGMLRAVIYFTPQTVTMDEAIPILEARGITVTDVRGKPAEQ
jgi:hypothetical protein